MQTEDNGGGSAADLAISRTVDAEIAASGLPHALRLPVGDTQVSLKVYLVMIAKKYGTEFVKRELEKMKVMGMAAYIEDSRNRGSELANTFRATIDKIRELGGDAFDAVDHLLSGTGYSTRERVNAEMRQSRQIPASDAGQPTYSIPSYPDSGTQPQLEWGQAEQAEKASYTGDVEKFLAALAEFEARFPRPIGMSRKQAGSRAVRFARAILHLANLSDAELKALSKERVDNLFSPL